MVYLLLNILVRPLLRGALVVLVASLLGQISQRLLTLHMHHLVGSHLIIWEYLDSVRLLQSGGGLRRVTKVLP